MGTTLTPMLTVRDAAGAIEFYREAFGASETAPRVTAPTGQIVAELAIDGQRFFVVDENVPAFNQSPETLKGTSVRLSLVVEDPDAVAARAVAAGATVVFPIADRSYGMRQGRIRDPYGHHWLIGKRL
jgi:PhnB protein